MILCCTNLKSQHSRFIHIHDESRYALRIAVPRVVPTLGTLIIKPIVMSTLGMGGSILPNSPFAPYRFLLRLYCDFHFKPIHQVLRRPFLLQPQGSAHSVLGWLEKQFCKIDL